VRVGVLEEGFADAEPGVRDTVLAAVELLERLGCVVSKVSVPRHHAIRNVQTALMAEGDLALSRVGFFGAFARTYYPPTLTAAVNKLWANEADALSPRVKMSFLAGELSRRRYHGRLYAKAQNVRPTFIKAYDDVLRDADVLVMPTVCMTAPKSNVPDSYLDAVTQNLTVMFRNFSLNTMAFDYTGHPALALPVGKVDGLPVSAQLVGRFFDDALLMRVAYAFQQASDWGSIVDVQPRV
jgi:amidase